MTQRLLGTFAAIPVMLGVLAASLPVRAQPAAVDGNAGFAAANAAAMDRMMAGMDIKPSGDVDRDFAAMMIAHHQGAVDMALAELRYGRNEQLRRIAQEIIVDQQQEIAAMRLAVGEPPPPSAPAPTRAAPDEPSATRAHLPHSRLLKDDRP